MEETSLNFEDIYTVYRPRILNYLKGIVGEYDAEDLTQEVFIKINRGLHEFRGESRLSTWIYRIATNAAKDRLRSPSYKKSRDSIEKASGIGKMPELEDINLWTGKRPYSVEDQLIHKEMNQCFMNYIEQLPENHRDVYVLSEMEGFTNKEIAAILGISAANVKIRLHRARSLLLKSLRSNCSSYYNDRGELMCEPKCVSKDQ